MEINQSRIGKSDEQKLWSSADDHQQWSSSSIVRSYTCSFCRKGFSNAQALGGHMNIHRKDRAKLREALDDENLLSLNSMNQVDDDHDHPYRHDRVSEDKNLAPLESSEEGSCIPKTPCSLSMEDDDASTSPADTRIGNFVDEEEDKKLQPGHGSTQIELDLELRLGPEPLETSSSSSTKSTTTTKEFF